MPNSKPHSLLRWREIPGGVWALGLVSLCMDASSEMIHALLPLYLVSVLGASTLEVGVIEGIAEATAAITKVFSGALSDWLGKRKWLTAAGYGLAALSKPLFPLAPDVSWVAAARFIDRIGKGIRGAPRDALIADLTPGDLRGTAYGLRQSLDTVGAFIGPGGAILFMALFADHFRTVFWIAVGPAFLAVAVIVLFVREPQGAAKRKEARAPLSRAELARLDAAYWIVVAVAAVFTLARFSEAFLLLRAKSVGMPLMWVPSVMVVMSVVYSLSAWPAGALSDRIGRYRLLLSGFALLIVADLVLAFAGGFVAVMIGVALWGLHMGLTQGLLSALVADTAPAHLRGTAFGVFNLVSGLAMLCASIIAGALWDVVGPDGTFIAGAVFTAIALAALPFAHRWRARNGH
ncbi:MAG TPA: MFS transporter [Pseudolabrys sp.]|nr:MFS transporter [Pseudolabrys sp.]